ncbi:MAG: EVE domain-containing protein [Alphaproteobacteria bacterium]|nr:MAG: EVE domain-containing protein [Alphaproteobacteria bacterium]
MSKEEKPNLSHKGKVVEADISMAAKPGMNINEEVVAVLSSDNPPESDKSTRDSAINIMTTPPVVENSSDGADQSNSRQTSFWILQARPDQFDLRTKIINGESTPWHVSRYQNQVRKGDLALFWLAGHDRGIYGWGTITSNPIPTGGKNGEFEFQVQYNAKFLFPIPLELVQRVLTPEHRLFTVKTGSIFDISSAEFLDLSNLIHLFGNQSPETKYGNLAGAIGDQIYHANSWLNEVDTLRWENKAYLAGTNTNFSYRAPLSVPDTYQTSIPQGVTLFSVFEKGLLFSGIAYQLSMFELPEIAEKWLDGIAKLDVKIEKRTQHSSGDTILFYEGTPFLPFEIFAGSLKHFIDLINNVLESLDNSHRHISNVFSEWIEYPESINPNRFSTLGDDPAPDYWKNIDPQTAQLLQLMSHAVSDKPTTKDTLGYNIYADAAAYFLRDKRSEAPLAMSIQAPWGGGKTSLMEMIRERLDQNRNSDDKNQVYFTGPHLTLMQMLKFLRQNSRKNSQPPSKLEDNGAISWRKRIFRTTLNRSKIVDTESIATPVTAENFPEQWITIWFNPWLYENSEQVWAGLADAIVRECAERRGPIERESFYLELAIKRTNPTNLRHKLYRDFIPATLIWFSGASVVMFGLLCNFCTSLELLPSTIIAAIVGAVPGGIVAHKRLNRDAIESYASLLSLPNYENSKGFRAKAESDIRHTFEIVQSRGKSRIAIFIDDLDRCSPKKVAEVFETLNNFISNKSLGCYVILGMDGNMVSAAIKKYFEDCYGDLPSLGRSESIGWNFLDKFIQIPFSIPKPSQGMIDRLTSSLSRSDIESQDDAPKTIDHKQGTAASDSKSTSDNNEISFIDPSKVSSLEHQKVLKRHSADLEDEKLLLSIKTLDNWDFDYNPRTIKRCLNYARYQYSIYLLLKQYVLDIPTEKALLNWIYFSFRWPDAARWVVGDDRPLNNEPTSNGEPISKIRLRELANYHSNRPTKIVNSESQGIRWLNDSDLRNYCSNSEKFGSVIDGAGHGLW